MIEIEVMVVEFSEDVSRNVNFTSILKGVSQNQLDISVGKITSIMDLNKTNLNQEFQATLNALIAEGKANVEVSPKISTLSGKEATINVTREEFFKVTTGNVQTPLTQLEKITSGIILTITPWASVKSDQIWVKVSSEVSSPTGVSAEGLPAISARKANSEVSIKKNETLVMGGLYQTRKTESEDRLPYLGKIPVMGHLFKKESKAEIKTEGQIPRQPHRLQQPADPHAQQRAGGATTQREQHAFGEQLPHQAHLSRAQRGADRDLLLPQRGAYKQEVGYIDASHQQHQPSERKEQRGDHGILRGAVGLGP